MACPRPSAIPATCSRRTRPPSPRGSNISASTIPATISPTTGAGCFRTPHVGAGGRPFRRGIYAARSSRHVRARRGRDGGAARQSASTGDGRFCSPASRAHGHTDGAWGVTACSAASRICHSQSRSQHAGRARDGYVRTTATEPTIPGSLGTSGRTSRHDDAAEGAADGTAHSRLGTGGHDLLPPWAGAETSHSPVREHPLRPRCRRQARR